MARDTFPEPTARSDHEARQARAHRKVADWEARARGGSRRQSASEQQVLNALRGSKAVVDFNKALLDYASESERPPAKLTPRQAAVMAKLASVTTDGVRHDPQYWLEGRNVCVQVRSLLMHGRIALVEGRLVAVASRTAPASQSVDTRAAVSAMRDLLSVGSPRIE